MGKIKSLRGDRLHIAIFGKRNAGKSSLINCITNQAVAIVSDTPGTTTDPVYKSMEIHPIGPVMLVDTAGLDDLGTDIGSLRVSGTERVFNKTDLAVLVIAANSSEFESENRLINQLIDKKIPYLIAINKSDLNKSTELLQWMADRKGVDVSALSGDGIEKLRKAIIGMAPENWEPPYVKDLIKPGDTVILVTPIDLGAPKGRLIMPQVKAIREILDADGIPIICKERELLQALDKLKEKPALVITDSQVFNLIAADVPEEIPMTSFSILSARQKGNLRILIEGLRMMDRLKPGDEVLIAESCTHHPMEDDIARVKIPRWLENHCGGNLKFKSVQGTEFPEDLTKYKLVVHCGGCILNRREMNHRIDRAAENSVSITNFGLIISNLKKVFPRAILPFGEYRNLLGQNNYNKSLEMTIHMSKLTEI